MCCLFFVTIKRQAFLLFVFLDSNWHHMRFFRYIINLFISIWNRNKIILLLKRNSICWVVACMSMLFFTTLRYILKGTFVARIQFLSILSAPFNKFYEEKSNFIVRKGIYCYILRNWDYSMDNILLHDNCYVLLLL